MTQKYFSKITQTLSVINISEFELGVNLVLKKWKEGKQIITLGNGGSAMTALHFITDWNKMIYLKTGIPFRGRTLVDNIGMITAYSNDLSYEDVFAEQLKNIMNEGDLVIGISGSGNSPNVLKAIEYANNNGATTLGLTGFSGGKLKNMVDTSIWVNVNDMQITEDIHAMFGHIVMQKVCNE